MNVRHFTKNLESIQTSLYKSEFLTKTNLATFSDEKLAMLLTQIAQIAINAALSLEELEQKERTLSLTEERTRQELELATMNAQMQNQIALIEALKGIIQADSIAKASGDNACINKANAYNAFLNIVANGENTDMIQKHADNVIKTISAISDKPMSAYDDLLKTLKAQIDILRNGLNANKEVVIYAPKLQMEQGETIKIMGFSSFGNNPCKFIVNGIETESKTMYFTAGESESQKITFSAKNKQGEWVSDSIEISIVKTELQKLEWSSIL
ncbi:hypothetical protein [Helicobacter sp.]|uniref:hypothetical protein n=1 Tax=Helicobacter sp. TaxID=218 RepID=UPI0019A51A1D|nr:hypothetical protein [Helicobacter sp.]MBD5164364.1 hypothetical protein [Helicobacter sp.]